MSTAIKTEIGYCTTERIYVRGFDLADELLGEVDFVEMIMLVVLGRRTSQEERNMLNAILVTVTDHGLTPSALAARLTYLGAPEAPQAAVAAGLLGAGSVFLGAMENSTQMLRDFLNEHEACLDSEEELGQAVRALFAKQSAAGTAVFGIGHNIHVHGDPRTPKLKKLAQENGFYGPHWRAIEAISAASQSITGSSLPINAAGAVGAIVADMGLPVSMARGLALVGRCAGLLGHILEEKEAPTGKALWNLVLDQDPRNETGRQ